LVVPEVVPDEDEPGDFFAVPSIADVPWPGARFDRGGPVMTFVASGANLAECEARLIQVEQKWTRHLGLM
jgi:hypothetical protein